MDRSFYHDAVRRMQDGGVAPDYVQGWIAGYLGNPKREEQRVTEAYEAGYADGENGALSGSEAWIEP